MFPIHPVIRFSACVPLLLLLSISPAAAQRQMEDISRGVVASRTASNTAYVSWRLLGHEAVDTGFNLYRSRNGGVPVRLNSNPITRTTDFRDTNAGFPEAVAYHVRAVTQGEEGPPSAPFTLPGDAPTRQFIPVPVDKPAGGVTPAGESYEYLINDISVGDLTGDGEYEFIVRWDPSNAKDNAHSGYTGNVHLDAYTLAGVRLWRIDLGRNIRAGAHYTQFIVYDLDGDGIAEISCKTAPGTIDGTGAPVLLPGHNVNADHRNSSGYILSGPEYLTVFNGGTGAAMATVPYIVPRHPATQNPSSSQLNSVWGDGYGNRVDRFLAGVAYLDGQRPSLIMSRGYYTRTAIAAWDWRNGQLTLRWLFDTHGNSPLNGYRGQGNHQLAIADVDGDGRDEIIFGSMTVNHDGTGLYTTGLGHGDALHVGDFDPDRPGLEVFMPHESPGSNGGIGASFRDARTGEIIWSTPATSDVGRGAMMDIDPRFPGAEGWATNSGDIFAAAGSVVGPRGNAFTNFGVWWDGSLLRQMLDNTTIARWRWEVGGGRVNLLTAWQQGAAQSNGTKSTPALSGDIFGDWREEVIWKNTDSTALLIFTATTDASQRLHTLMHDPTYRLAIAWQNVAYNQPPHPGFYLGPGMPAPPRPPIWKGDRVWKGGASPQQWSAGSNRFKSSPTATGTLAFANGQSVLFDGSGPAAAPVQIEGVITPAEVVIHNPARHDYVFAGSGRIDGSTGLVKSGHGVATVGGGHTFTGKTVVNQGELRLAGTLASAVTVQGLGRFSGSGRVGGLATEPRAIVSPGSTVGDAATLEIEGDASFDGTTFEFDLPFIPGQPGDLIAVTGKFVLDGENPLVFRFPTGTPAPGTYPLFTFNGTLGGGLEQLSYDPSFATLESRLSIAAGTIRLEIIAPSEPESLVWRGTGGDWDTTSQNWLRDGSPSAYDNLDLATFTQAGATAPVVALQGALSPGGVMVASASANYTFNGPGSLTGDTTLGKSGSGTLTINTANTHGGGTTISGGTLAIGNASALGTGPVTLAGGTWATGTLTPANPVLVAMDSTVTGGHGGGNHGLFEISGPSHTTLTCLATNVFDFERSLAGFHGRLLLGGAGSFRFWNPATDGANLLLDLGDRGLSVRSGASCQIGALTGLPGSGLWGSSGGGNNAQVTFTIGARNTSSIFAGTIANGNNLTHLVKTGSAALTLAGNSTFTGNTTVQSGTLEVTGSLANTPLTVRADGRLSGSGTIAGGVTSQGRIDPQGTLTLGNGLTTTAGSGLGFHLGDSSDRIVVTGDLALAGRIEISAMPAITSGVYPLIHYSGNASFGNLELVVLPGDFTCDLDTSTPGRVDAIVTSTLSDFEQWQILHFGGTDNPLAQAGEDPDGDGQANEVEFLAGTDPNDGSSIFAATIEGDGNGGFLLTWPSLPGRTYEIRSNSTLSGTWNPLQTIPAGPGNSTSFLISPVDGDSAFFFKVRIVE